MFLDLLYNLRGEGLPVGIGEWMAFLEGLSKGLATDLDGVYGLGRALLCRSEADFDAFDLAFAKTFDGIELPPDVKRKLEEWLQQALSRPDVPLVHHEFQSREDLWKQFLERLKQQTEQHHGGNRWVGTGGTSPFGNNGRADQGLRVGGEGGGRSAIQVAGDRQWANYRDDRTLDIRDLTVVLRTLRAMTRDGALELDIDETIDKTADNGGEIELVEQPERRNNLRVVLLMDTGGSMAPHVDVAEKLFSAAKKVKTFRSLDVWFFHNCVYGWLYKDYESMQRKRTGDVLEQLTPKHRLVFVGDASMAPYELFSPWGWPGDGSLSGIDWLKKLKERCPASVWLNPDPLRWWNHPTVTAIGHVFPMYELTLDGLRRGVRKLRAPV